MPSRSLLTPLSRNKTPEAADLNAVYYILNGSYETTRGPVTETTTRGLGMPVKLTGFDGRMATGLLDVTSYALDVRNRELTQQRALAVRKANNQIAFEVTGGKSYSPFNVGATVSTQVLVNGSTAGGVLTGTYPNPDFWLPLESYRFRPKMMMPWAGSNAVVLVAGNLELQDAPGWVLCNGATVTMRDGTSVTVPNMNDRYPIGAGGTYALGAVSGNTLSTQQALDVAHSHSHDHAHTHGIPAHAHNHQHNLSGHTHSVNNHNHDMQSHSHDLQFHTHGLQSHTHDMQFHTHSGPDHQHGLTNTHVHGPGSLGNTSHGHGSGTYSVSISLNTGGPSGTSARADGANNVASETHTHNVSSTVGVSGSSSNSAANIDTGFTSNPTSGNTGNGGTGSTGTPSNNTSNGPSNNTSGTPSNNTSTGPSTNSTSLTGLTSNGPSVADTGSDNTGWGPDTTNSKTASTDASGASRSSINGQPPTIAVHWIFKL